MASLFDLFQHIWGQCSAIGNFSSLCSISLQLLAHLSKFSIFETLSHMWAFLNTLGQLFMHSTLLRRLECVLERFIAFEHFLEDLSTFKHTRSTVSLFSLFQPVLA